MTDENPTPAPDEAPAQQQDPMFIMHLQLELPNEIAEFNIMEKVAIPRDVVEQIGVLEQWIDQALTAQFFQVTGSIKDTLMGVIKHRAASDAPLTMQQFHQMRLEEYQAQEQAMLAMQEAARAAEGMDALKVVVDEEETPGGQEA